MEPPPSPSPFAAYSPKGSGVHVSHPALRPRSASFLQAFLKSEALGGYVLMLALLALCRRQQRDRASSFRRAGRQAALQPGPRRPRESVLHWINDGLMAVFFLLVGLEIKREVLEPARRLAHRAARHRRWAA